MGVYFVQELPKLEGLGNGAFKNEWHKHTYLLIVYNDIVFDISI